jgi:hypothetical protein
VCNVGNCLVLLRRINTNYDVKYVHIFGLRGFGRRSLKYNRLDSLESFVNI